MSDVTSEQHNVVEQWLLTGGARRYNPALHQATQALLASWRKQKEEIERLTSRRDSLTGWWVAKDCEDGSLILESHAGERKHVWKSASTEQFIDDMEGG